MPGPALVTSASREPKRSTVLSTSPSQAAGSVTSVGLHGEGALSELLREGAQAISSWRAARTVLQPAATRRRVVASPMPEDAPVTIAVFPARFPLIGRMIPGNGWGDVGATVAGAFDRIWEERSEGDEAWRTYRCFRSTWC